MIELQVYSTVPEEISLAERYWVMNREGKFDENVADLLPFQNIANSTQLAAFVRNISQAWDMNQSCAQCGGYEEIRSRSEAKRTPSEMRTPCAACQRVVDEERHVAEASAKAELEHRLAIAIKNAAARTIEYADLSDDVVLILIALERALNPRLLTGTFMRADCRALAPCYVGDFITKLYKATAIIDAPGKARSGTYYIRDDQLWHTTDQAIYFLAPDSNFGSGEQAFKIISSRPLQDNRAIRNLWFDYATTDCMAYLFEQCHQHGLSTTVEDDAQMHSTIRTALQIYSVAQLWSAIWRIVKDAATLSTRSYYTSDKAAATLPGKMLRLLEKVSNNESTLREWNRPELQPAGTLGQVFCERYGIDENTNGVAVMSFFTDPIPDEIATGIITTEFAGLVRNILKSALAQDLAADMMLYFADSIRRGLDDTSAINKLLEAFPELGGTTDV